MAKRKSRKPKKVTVEPTSSVALKRLIEEVRVGKDEPRGGYNRTYHRHNR